MPLSPSIIVEYAARYRLQCPVSLRTVEDGDHQLSRPQDLELILEAITELLNPEECAKSAEQED